MGTPKPTRSTKRKQARSLKPKERIESRSSRRAEIARATGVPLEPRSEARLESGSTRAGPGYEGVIGYGVSALGQVRERFSRLWLLNIPRIKLPWR